jgi:hypothetical protein
MATLLNHWGNSPRKVQREIVKFLDRNGPATAKTIGSGIYQGGYPSYGGSGSIPQNLNSLNKQKLVKKSSTLWQLTAAGAAQANAWAIADGEKGFVIAEVETKEVKYKWGIIKVTLKELEQGKVVGPEHEPFGATEPDGTVWFRKLIEDE